MKPPIRLVALDMAGTTVADDGAVEEAFQHALDVVGLTAGQLRSDPQDYIRRTMGQSKITVFTELLGGDRHRADEANAAFEDAFDQRRRPGGGLGHPRSRVLLDRAPRGGDAPLPDHGLLPRHP